MKIILLLISIFQSIFFNNLFAQAGGDLDYTFDFDGIVSVSFDTSYEGITAIAIQPDNKIIVAGYSYINDKSSFALCRFNTDGTLDNSFSGDGMLRTDFDSTLRIPYSVIIQPDGKIIAAGYAITETDIETDIFFALVRFLSDGSIDNSFGINGVVKTVVGSGLDKIYSAVLQPDGKIIAAGITATGSGNDFAIVRYNDDGSLDNSFGSDGIVTTDINSDNETITSVVLQADGKIVVGGWTENITDEDYAIARYHNTGDLDNSFGIDGKTITSIGSGFDVITALKIQNDNKILASGYSLNETNRDFSLARYNADGNLDLSFNITGTTITDFNSEYDYSWGNTIQADGKIIVVGYTKTDELYDIAIARYNIDGTLDTSFGDAGLVITTIDTLESTANAVALTAEEKIIVGGTVGLGNNYDMCLLRYTLGLDVGIIDFEISKDIIYVYPNPISNIATLDYTLKSKETISIYLFDVKGGKIKCFIENEIQLEGKHEQIISFPEKLSAGNYFIIIESGNERLSIQVTK